MLARTRIVTNGVEPGEKRPRELKLFRAFLTGPKTQVNNLLLEALRDPAPVVAAWALFGISEIDSPDGEDLPKHIFDRSERVSERLGDYVWTGTLAEIAVGVEKAYRTVREEDESEQSPKRPDSA